MGLWLEAAPAAIEVGGVRRADLPAMPRKLVGEGASADREQPTKAASSPAGRGSERSRKRRCASAWTGAGGPTTTSSWYPESFRGSVKNTRKSICTITATRTRRGRGWIATLASTIVSASIRALNLQPPAALYFSESKNLSGESGRDRRFPRSPFEGNYHLRNPRDPVRRTGSTSDNGTETPGLFTLSINERIGPNW